jgi:hypothetical protein
MPRCAHGCASSPAVRFAGLLTREGIVMNNKKLRRLDHEERLQFRRRSGRKRALGKPAPMAIPQGPNQRWSLDFLSDAFRDGRRFRILAIVDELTRSPAGHGPGFVFPTDPVAAGECAATARRDPPDLYLGRRMDG